MPRIIPEEWRKFMYLLISVSMFRLKFAVIFAHIVGWLICLGLPLLFLNGQTGSNKTTALLLSPDYLVFVLTYISLFYFHTNFLFPQLYYRKQYALYFLTVAVLLLMILVMQPFDHLFSTLSHPEHIGYVRNINPMPRPRIHVDIVSIFLFLLTIALGIAIETTHQWRQTEKRALYAETWKTQAELSFLKAQINPHFLFNTLNNIYSLAMSKHEYTADSIMKLSNMLRYVTADTRDDYVLLEREIDCIHDYIDLQKLRLSTKTKVRFSVTGNPGFKCIAPLVLLPFLENAFKYGVSNQEASDIIIALNTSPHKISFYCSNKLFTIPQETSRTGIGITNTRQRLDHLYPDKYELVIKEDNGVYAISLQLQV